MKTRIAVVFLILSVLSIFNVEPLNSAEPPTPTVIQNVSYVPNGDSLQVMDLTLPVKSDGSFPVILAIHGGGGDKTEFTAWAKYFAELGFATVSINFRGMPDNDTSPEKSIYPASVKDTFYALAWICANADTYRFDIQRIAALGFSLGGTLTAMLGTVDDRTPFLKDCPYPLTDEQQLKGVVTVSAVFDYGLPMSPRLEQYTTAYLGADCQSNPQLWEDASPITWVSGNEPPFLLLHGQSDKSIDANQPNAFIAALRKANESVDFRFLPGGHMAVIRNPEAYKITGDFLKKVFE